MSFTSEVKKELLDAPLESECCKYSMLAGILSFAGSVKTADGVMTYSLITENKTVAQKIVYLSTKLFVVNPTLIEKGNVYLLTIPDVSLMIHELDLIKWGDIGFSLPDNLQSECCIRSYIKGAFLSGGSVTSPEKRYHLEFVTPHYHLNMQFQELFEHFDIPAKWIIRKSKYVTYFKDNEIICDVLALMGAGKAVIEVSNTNIVKNVKNNTNRIMNCENANMDKAINAALKQAGAIEIIDEKIGIKSLPENLQQIAYLRLENKDLSLVEIAQMLTPPISKSGVNHRMRKLIEISLKL